MAPWLDLLQWPAMLATVLAAWLVASNEEGRRQAGFWVFLASNLLWVGWAGTPAPPRLWRCSSAWPP